MSPGALSTVVGLKIGDGGRGEVLQLTYKDSVTFRVYGLQQGRLAFAERPGPGPWRVRGAALGAEKPKQSREA